MDVFNLSLTRSEVKFPILDVLNDDLCIKITDFLPGIDLLSLSSVTKRYRVIMPHAKSLDIAIKTRKINAIDVFFRSGRTSLLERQKALYEASSIGDLHLVKKILSNGEISKAHLNLGFEVAVARGFASLSIFFLEKDLVSGDSRDIGFLLGCTSSNCELVHALIKKGGVGQLAIADALLKLAAQGRAEMVGLILKNTEVPELTLLKAIEAAGVCGQLEVVRILIQNLKNTGGERLMMISERIAHGGFPSIASEIMNFIRLRSQEE